MVYESEWDGFATQSRSGIAEALYAAGVDCGIHPHGEVAHSGPSAWDADRRPPPDSVAE